jgi:hypothetical protein
MSEGCECEVWARYKGGGRSTLGFCIREDSNRSWQVKISILVVKINNFCINS